MRFARSVAGIVTFLVNRLGDVFFLLRIRLVFFLSSWNCLSLKEVNIFLAFSLLLTFATKRAQIPFSS
jgi:hypothetical protein